MRVELVIIDPQKDFCNPNGSLFVPGAPEDMGRTADLIRRKGDVFNDIHITYDSHRQLDIAHPLWFKDSSGNHPDPFTLISAEDLRTGKWTTTMPGAYKRTLAYLEALEASGRYAHTIWPYHCLIGTEGHNLHDDIRDAVFEWEMKNIGMHDAVTKGSNPWTEHFSAIKAEVPDPSDPSTQVNTDFVRTLEECDLVLLAGEASTHCWRSTVEDLANEFADPTFLSKCIALQDCMSPVPDPIPGLFSDPTANSFADLKARGLRFMDSDQVLT